MAFHTVPYGDRNCMEQGELMAFGVSCRIWIGAKGVSGYAMAIFEKANKFALDKPSGKEFPHHSKRQLITNTVSEQARAGTLRIHFVGVFPSAERAGNLEVAKLASFDVIAMHEGPANFEWAHTDAQDALVAVADSWRSLQDFDGLPGRGEAFEGVRLRMPAKNFFGGRVNSRLCGEIKLARHKCECSLSCESFIERLKIESWAKESGRTAKSEFQRPHDLTAFMSRLKATTHKDFWVARRLYIGPDLAGTISGIASRSETPISERLRPPSLAR